jgi:hypothetical protein
MRIAFGFTHQGGRGSYGWSPLVPSRLAIMNRSSRKRIDSVGGSTRAWFGHRRLGDGAATVAVMPAMEIISPAWLFDGTRSRPRNDMIFSMRAGFDAILPSGESAWICWFT